MCSEYCNHLNTNPHFRFGNLSDDDDDVDDVDDNDGDDDSKGDSRACCYDDEDEQGVGGC